MSYPAAPEEASLPKNARVQAEAEAMETAEESKSKPISHLPFFSFLLLLLQISRCVCVPNDGSHWKSIQLDKTSRNCLSARLVDCLLVGFALI